MSLADAVGLARLDLADPAIMLYALGGFIVVCLLLDAPAIAGAVRLLRILRRRAKSSRADRSGILIR